MGKSYKDYEKYYKEEEEVGKEYTRKQLKKEYQGKHKNKKRTERATVKPKED